MAKVKLQINVPEPCEQDWNAMIPQGNGRFCDVCQKCVIDFSTKSDREVIEIFSRSNNKVCGRFREDQLNRNLILPQQALISGWRLFALTFGALFATDLAHAQTTKPKQAVLKNYTSAKPAQQNCKFLMISGTVKNRYGEPLKEAFIGLKNKPGILAYTDSSGNFRFKLPENWITNSKQKRVILTFSRTGYHLYEQPVSTLKNHRFAITLDALPEEMKKEENVAEITAYEPPVIGPEKISTIITGEILRIPTRIIVTSKDDSYYKMKHDLKD
ncbi:hypothetical protein I5M27_13435 [Adhaeribacter sp. BT258]|uniref:CarboxypepD_reg-like domain-containing protein n=1 Tax=Adhaeribacter terrigena TaxID=2793070 RepID=A0ABS1C3L1_9BACT|nr:hypothetical protein [Adhaeribacter terrigena]MBK0403992.1 hypothetical protein [Adhaeribacter terrigena]